MQLDLWYGKGGGVKRDVELKGASHQVSPKRVVNLETWARQAMGEQDCQNQVDTKALTGRGNLARLRQQVDELEEVVKRMKSLCQQSKEVVGLGCYLVVHKRSETGYVFLRWRQGDMRARHLSFEEVDEQSKKIPHHLRRWCDEASRIAISLNGQHRDIRASIKRLKKDIEGMPSHIFPRSVQRAK